MKTRKQKYMIMLACVFLLASFICIPVSAAIEDGGKAQYDTVRFSPQQGDNTAFFVVYDRGPFDQPFSVSDGMTWSQLKSSTPIVTSTRFPLFVPDQDVDIEMFNFSFSSSDTTLCASYVFGGEGALFSSDDSTVALESAQLYLLNYGLFYLATSMSNSQGIQKVGAIRFSLRSVGESVSGMTIGTVVAETDTFYPTLTPDGNYDVSEVFISNWRFAVRNAPLPAGDYLLCVDVTLNSDLTSNNYDISFGSPTGLKVYRFADLAGAYPYYPELSNPMFQNPDLENVRDLIQLEGIVNDQYHVSDTSNQIGGVLQNLTSGLSDFSIFFARISSVMTYFTNNIPYLHYIMIFSLALGLFGLVFGLGQSIFGAAVDTQRRAEREQQAEFQARQRANYRAGLSYFYRQKEKRDRERSSRLNYVRGLKNRYVVPGKKK